MGVVSRECVTSVAAPTNSKRDAMFRLLPPDADYILSLYASEPAPGEPGRRAPLDHPHGSRSPIPLRAVVRIGRVAAA